MVLLSGRLATLSSVFCVYLATFISDNINMLFWENTKKRIKAENTTQEWVANETEISYETFRSWISKGILPRADQAVSIAKALNTTVEYLVTGEKTDTWKPPARYADIVQNLEVMDETGLYAVRRLAQSYAAQSEQSEKREA